MENVLNSPAPQRPANDAHEDEHVTFRKWMDEANVAQYIILAFMNNELQKEYEYMDTRAILLYLQGLHSVQSRTTRYEISRELFYARMAEGTSVNDHVLKIIDLIERLE